MNVLEGFKRARIAGARFDPRSLAAAIAVTTSVAAAAPVPETLVPNCHAARGRDAAGVVKRTPWTIRGIGLDSPSLPCKPELRTYRNQTGSPGSHILECALGEPNDVTRVTFSPDGKQVVRVVRTQYLKASDPQPIDILSQALKFYGRPDAFEPKAELANYGDAFAVTHLSGSTQIVRNPCGQGLLIRAQSCGDGTFGLEDCAGLGTRFLRYELVDNSSLKQAVAIGQRNLMEADRKSLERMKF